jgi:hypothetical protein
MASSYFSGAQAVATGENTIARRVRFGKLRQRRWALAVPSST